MIRLRNRDKEVCVRALLDDGSQQSYIEENLATELFLSPSGREIFSQGLFGRGISPASEHKRYMANVENVGRDSPPIRVLLGADILGSILTGRIEVLTSGVSAVETLLGWTILELGKKREVVNLDTLSFQNMDVPKMWDLEVLGITDPIEKKNKNLLEEETLAHFKETIRICEDQRYEVALPWLAGNPALYDKYDAAESTLFTATKRLINENYFEAYDNVFKQWESEGIIEAVPIDQLTKEAHYLPHRPGIKPSSNTTKVRPVFDTSFKKPGFASLKECLSVGPSLIRKILPLQLRFRFGAIEREKFQTKSLRKTIGHLKEGFYVDNLIMSVNDITELEQLKSQSIEIMKEGAFELHCWASNDSKEDQDMQKVLGLSWDVVSDELSCKLPSNLDCTQERPVTKTVLLSGINSVYDPIGFTAPALLLPKLLMQEAWRGKIGWDEVLPLELEHKYRLREKTMHLMSKCTIPRRFFAENFDDFTLHIFTDASPHAYATCAFLRCEFKGQVTVKLIAANARLAPMKKSTISRLELLGAALGARIIETVHSILRTASKTYFWSDLMVVLSWIKKKEPWNTFFGNRVKQIRDLTNIDDWRHVPGDVNPADLATRCCDWSDLLKSKWWEAPGWLYSDEESWPYSEVSEAPDEAFLERRKMVVTNLATLNEVRFGNRFLYFSS
ncbi:integrase catalytic domain-containing protein [Trichonephila inaurata madagascariensis]|uniref:Integrase catalytic domain-containing protein n=1 Tax=Trichonephila inaurata madagascariensis TaxID=2747483 RepID=A0A8X7BQB5_9ARAC|nr:integrase catalytic domain-containing protein [Trichonephila inaurata madagascariensis]